VSGYPEVGEHPMTVVRDTDPDTISRAESAIARRAQREGWTRDQLVDVLEHLGMRKPSKPVGGHSNPVGKNVSPEAQRRRRERNTAAKRAARAEAKEKDES
jgi:hypothetical protein